MSSFLRIWPLSHFLCTSAAFVSNHSVKIPDFIPKADASEKAQPEAHMLLLSKRAFLIMATLSHTNIYGFTASTQAI